LYEHFYDLNSGKQCFLIYGERELSFTNPEELDYNKMLIQSALEGDTKARYELFEQNQNTLGTTDIIFNDQRVSNEDEIPIILQLDKADATLMKKFPQVVNYSSGPTYNVYQPQLPTEIAANSEIRSSLHHQIPHTSQLTMSNEEKEVLERAGVARNQGTYQGDYKVSKHESQMSRNPDVVKSKTDFTKLRTQWKVVDNTKDQQPEEAARVQVETLTELTSNTKFSALPRLVVEHKYLAVYCAACSGKLVQLERDIDAG
jgi:hypothetical protein